MIRLFWLYTPIVQVIKEIELFLLNLQTISANTRLYDSIVEFFVLVVYLIEVLVVSVRPLFISCLSFAGKCKPIAVSSDSNGNILKTYAKDIFLKKNSRFLSVYLKFGERQRMEVFFF